MVWVIHFVQRITIKTHISRGTPCLICQRGERGVDFNKFVAARLAIIPKTLNVHCPPLSWKARTNFELGPHLEVACNGVRIILDCHHSLVATILITAHITDCGSKSMLSKHNLLDGRPITLLVCYGWIKGIPESTRVVVHPFNKDVRPCKLQ